MVRRASASLGLAVFALVALGGVSHAFAAGGNSSGPSPADPEFIQAVVLGTTYMTSLDSANYDNSLGPLSNSVSLNEYAVTATSPETISITIADLFYVGDYYQLYEDTDSGFTSPPPTLVGETPQVETGPSLEAPSYNPLWDGGGSTYSTGTFTVTVGTGTTYFVVVDALFAAMGTLLDGPCHETTDQLLSEGCSVTGSPAISVSSGFNPAGYAITFNPGTPIGAPEFGATPLAAVAVILPLLMILRGRRPHVSGP